MISIDPAITTIRTVIIANNESVSKSLKLLLKSSQQLEVISTARSTEDGIKIIEQQEPDVAIVDLDIPYAERIEAIDLIVRHSRKTKVVIYTSTDAQFLNQAIAFGVKGYVLHSSPIVDLIAAIQAANRHNIYIAKETIASFKLTPTGLQKEKIKHLNSWLAKQVLQRWQSGSQVKLTLQEAIADLAFDIPGSLWMKSYLCQQDEENSSLAEEIISAITGLFAQVESSFRPELKLKEKRRQILDILDNSSTNGYCYTQFLEKNFQSLQTLTTKKLQKAVWQLSKEASPLPQQLFLQSLKEQLSDWQAFLDRESKKHQDKQQAALHSFDRLLMSSKDNKQKTCRRAATLAYESRIEADLYALMGQIVAETIERLNIYLINLDKTNTLLTESLKKLGSFSAEDVAVYTPFFKQLEAEIFVGDLQYKLEATMKQPLELWGVSKFISSKDINIHLIEKLEPITQKLYLNLHREVLGLPFFEQAARDNYQALISSPRIPLETIATKQSKSLKIKIDKLKRVREPEGITKSHRSDAAARVINQEQKESEKIDSCSQKSIPSTSIPTQPTITSTTDLWLN
jgi:DNA-binding NarL/FixJ family response regulator